ncbi:MAG: penicillin acylase family protein, partial [Pseudomonadota bacterium]
QLEIPSQSVYGVSLIGIPMVGIGFNEYGGWTHTVNEYDGVDIYELTLKEGGYVFDGEILPFETSTETYAVKQADGSLKTQELVIQKSVHGPLLSQTDEKAYAVRFSGLESFGMLQQYWDMAAAKNLSEFEAAQKQLQMPFFNTFYANSEGDIYYLHGGALPNRKKGDHEFWSGLIPGDRSEFLWQGTLGYDALPQFSNPAAGFIQNANEPPWYTTFPPVLKSEDYLPFVASREEAWFRPQHSMRQVIEDTSITFEELVEMKQSTQLELADRILPELLEAAASSTTPIVVEARDILANWDRQANADSRGAVLFIAWAEYFFEQEEGNPLFATPWDEDNPYTTPDGLANTEMAVALLEKAATQIKATHGTLDIAYGDAYRLRRGDVDMPASGGPSFVGAYKIAEGRMGEDGITTISSGNTFSAVVEFGTPLKAVGSLPYGTSSQEASPHISDQLSLFSKNEMRPIWFYEEDVEENAMRTETLLAE